eukprot:GILJ01010877.1.p1 GENE.GILJ01010877.1~~GILJ01010877.1.p1  ORF type:complete len:118 (-),score=15.08 GILJ01010877.1:120-473(-)
MQRGSGKQAMELRLKRLLPDLYAFSHLLGCNTPPGRHNENHSSPSKTPSSLEALNDFLHNKKKHTRLTSVWLQSTDRGNSNGLDRVAICNLLNPVSRGLMTETEVSGVRDNDKKQNV